MGRRPSPSERLAVTAQDAAWLLSLSTHEFLEMVDAGALPGPFLLGGKYPLWAVAPLAEIVTGESAIEDDFET